VSITVSFDMSWNKRSSGNRYDSISGHAFFIGCLSKTLSLSSSPLKFALSVQLLSLMVKSPRLTSAPETMTAHPKRWSQTLLFTSTRGYSWVLTKKVILMAIVADDDSSMRALLRHPDNNPKGKLPLEIPEPEWLTDPSHRTKVVAKPFYALASLPKKQSTCTNIDAM